MGTPRAIYFIWKQKEKTGKAREREAQDPSKEMTEIAWRKKKKKKNQEEKQTGIDELVRGNGQG